MRIKLPTPDTGRRFRLLDQLDGVAGAYIIHLGTQAYVGSSANLRIRLRTHVAKYGGSEVAIFVDTQFKIREQKIIEALLAENVSLTNLVSARQVPKFKIKNPRKPRYVKKGPRYRRFVTVDGITKPMSVWCRETGISVELALQRIEMGWTGERAVIFPKRRP